LFRSVLTVYSYVIDEATCGFSVILRGVAHISNETLTGLLPIVFIVIDIGARFINIGLCGVQQFLAGVLPIILMIIDIAGYAISGVFKPVSGLTVEFLSFRLIGQGCLNLLARALATVIRTPRT